MQWPYAYVADGPGGLVIVDVRAPIAPRIVGGLRVSETKGGVDRVVDVEVMFQYSRPMTDDMDQPTDERTPARNLCALIDEEAGLALIDVTEPGHPRKLFPRPNQRSRGQRDNLSYRGLELRSHVDLAEPQGGTRTREGRLRPTCWSRRSCATVTARRSRCSTSAIPSTRASGARPRPGTPPSS